MDDNGRVRVPSWREVFHTPWRIARFWGFDFTWIVPGGPTALALGCVVLVGAVMLLLNGMGVTLGQSWLLRVVAVPLGAGWFASQRMPDGRGVFSHAYTVTRAAALAAVNARRRPSSWKPRGRVPVRWDGSCPRPLPGMVEGPALVQFNRPVRLGGRGSKVTATADPTGAPGTVVVRGGTRVVIR